MYSKYVEVLDKLAQLRRQRDKHLRNIDRLETVQISEYRENKERFLEVEGIYNPPLVEHALAIDKQIEDERKASDKIQKQIGELLRTNPINHGNDLIQR